LTIFGTNIPDTSGHQTIPHHPTSVSTLPGKTELMRYKFYRKQQQRLSHESDLCTANLRCVSNIHLKY